MQIRPAAELDMGRVSSRTFGVLGANFLPFFLLAFLFSAIPGYVLGLAVNYVSFELIPGMYDNVSLAAFVGILQNFIISLPYYIAAGAITHGCIIAFNGGQLDMGDCIATGVRKFVPLFLLGLVSTIAILLGSILLIIPGIIVAVAIIVSTPVLIVERGGVFHAMTRSSQLTENNRWRIFWLCVAILIAFSLIGMVQTMVQDAVVNYNPLSQPTGGAYLPNSPAAWISVAFALLVDALTSLIGAAGVASLYYELRTSREGATSEELAKVFD